jgi:hypothetical protein
LRINEESDETKPSYYTNPNTQKAGSDQGPIDWRQQVWNLECGKEANRRLKIVTSIEIEIADPEPEKVGDNGKEHQDNECSDCL